MEYKTILESAQERVILMDGGMGTMLIADGLPKGDPPELWDLNFPEKIASIHKKYFDAGSEAVLTNTFGGTSIKLRGSGLEDHVKEINKKAAEIVRSVCPDGCYVVGDVGPTGQFLAPMGNLTEEELRAAVEEQIIGLLDGGADCLIIETMYDMQEAMIGLEIAKRLTSLPVIVSYTFNQTPRGYFTLVGNSVKDAISTADSQGADIIGTNCTLDSSQIIGLAREIRDCTQKPVIVQPNAGSPEMIDGKIEYSSSIEDFTKNISELLEIGINLVGGCCGTNPSYIKAIRQLIDRRI